MVDFLKAYPFVTMDDYRWKLNPRMVRLMCADNTRVHYLSEKQAEMRNAVEYNEENAKNFSDMGIPIFK